MTRITTAWMALSTIGLPALYVGAWATRKDLIAAYVREHPDREWRRSGYKAVRVSIAYWWELT
jgi:hypothetical protein